MKKKILLCLLGALTITIKAQLFDSLKVILSNKYSLDARFESRYSFLNQSAIKVGGIRVGLVFQRKLRIGTGISWLKTEITKEEPTSDGTGLPSVKFLQFIYQCYYVDFVFHKTKRWQLSVPLQVGIGCFWYQTERYIRSGNKDPKHMVLLYEPGVTVQFKAFKWVGIGCDLAYRFAISQGKKSGINFNSPTYNMKWLFWFDQLYYVLFPKSRITKRFGPSHW